jgi:thymidine kinase
MAKLYFYHSVMNAGKSSDLLRARYSYLENGFKVMLFSSVLDNRSGVGVVSSRDGKSAPAYPIGQDENIFDLVEAANGQDHVHVVMVDEVQFMTAEQIVQLSDIVDRLGIVVMTYGLKNNYQGDLFGPAVQKLLAVANEIREVISTCHCGRKAIMILKYNMDGSVVRDGEVVETGGESRYVSVCRPHFKSETLGPVAERKIADHANPLKVVCRTCSGRFKMIFDDIEQAMDCAAMVEGNGVSGYYGSRIADGRSFLFEKGRPHTVAEGVICDACIQTRIDDGTLVREL